MLHSQKAWINHFPREVWDEAEEAEEEVKEVEEVQEAVEEEEVE